MPRRRPRRNGDRGRRNLLAAVATGVAGIGLGVNVLRPSAYTSAVTDRGATAPVADDPNAILGLENLRDTSVTPTVTNQSSSAMDVTLSAAESGVEWDLDDDGTYVSDPVTFGLSSGTTRTVAVRGADEVTTNISVAVSSGGTTTGRIDLQRTIDVPQSNIVQKIQGSAKAAGNSGKYEFELENTGGTDVTLVGIGIEQTTNQNAASVRGGGILVAGPDSVLSTPIPIDSSTPSQDTRVDFEQTVSLGAGQTESFEFERFQTSSNDNAKMKGEDVRATFYFSDGSSSTIDLCLNGCNF